MLEQNKLIFKSSTTLKILLYQINMIAAITIARISCPLIIKFILIIMILYYQQAQYKQYLNKLQILQKEIQDLGTKLYQRYEVSFMKETSLVVLRLKSQPTQKGKVYTAVFKDSLSENSWHRFIVLLKGFGYL